MAETKQDSKRTYVVLVSKGATEFKKLGEYQAGSAEGAMRQAVEKAADAVGTSGSLVAVPMSNWSASPFRLQPVQDTKLVFGGDAVPQQVPPARSAPGEA